MLRVISLWCVWTLTTLGHSVLAQRLLRVHGLSSVDVAAAEFLFGSMAVLVHAAGSKQRLQPVMVAVFSQPGRAWLLAALHAAGSWATLHAMTSLTVPLVQSFKASETLLTSVACMFLLGATYRPNYFQAVMLLGISVGLAVATGASLAGGRWSTVAVALGGSLCVVLRNVLSKRLPELYGVALNAWLTVGGLICMMPPCAVRLATGQGLLATTTVSTGAQLQVLVLGLAATGILHWAYNAVSCVVLALVARPTTHSVMKAGQRLAVVVGAAVYIRQDSSATELAAISLALVCAAGYTLGNRPSDDKVGDGSLRLAAPAGAPGAPGRHPRAAYDRPSLLASLLASVAVVAALTFTLTTQGALHGGGEATRESGAVDISAYLDNGGVPWHFEVVYSVMQYAKRAHSVRSFVMSDSFVAYSDRKALLAACMADETITLVPGIPTLRGKHPGNTNSAIGRMPCGPGGELWTQNSSLPRLSDVKVDLLIVLTVYPCAEPYYASLRDNPQTLLFLHRVDSGAFTRWTNAIHLTSLARHAGGRWLVPTEYACNRALPAMPQPVAPPHATYIVQGSMARRDVKQLWSLLRRTPADVNFTIKILSRQRLHAPPNVSLDRVRVVHGSSDLTFASEIASSSHVLPLLSTSAHRRYLTTQPTSSVALALGYGLPLVAQHQVQQAYGLKGSGNYFYDDDDDVVGAFQASVRDYAQSQAERRPPDPPLAVPPIYGPELVKGLPCRQRLSLYYWEYLSSDGRLGANFGDEVNKDVLTWITGALSEAELQFSHQWRSNADPDATGGRLVATGSVLGHAQHRGDVVWGSGLHEKTFHLLKRNTRAHVVGVRGPLTAEKLARTERTRSARPPVLGDPALLLPLVWSHLRRARAPAHAVCVVLHYSDLKNDETVATAPGIVVEAFVVGQQPQEVMKQLLDCELVVSTSLHGIIFAEAFGIPARWVHDATLPSSKEGVFKYNDHLLSTGRPANLYASSMEEAVRMGGMPPIDDATLRCRQRALMLAFPFHEVFDFAVQAGEPGVMTCTFPEVPPDDGGTC